MAFVDLSSHQHATYETHSHGEETLLTKGGKVPGQMRWSDIHSPSLKVLPKGSPPAGTGEINWENTLGGRFALALEKLEGLLYALFGSRPGAYDMSGTWRKCQWYDRVHPRCLWGPETWERQIHATHPTSIDRYQYQSTGKEYAALGQHPPCCPLPAPSVPIRTRSGDPFGQYMSGVHDRVYFPVGSVERDFQNTYPFDPEGSGWFGATQPGRNDAAQNPWLATANEYTWKAGEAVKIRYRLPDGVLPPTSMTLRYRFRLPNGSWSGNQSVAMAPVAEAYEATIPLKPHGTQCRWYVQYLREDVIRYDPGGSSPPLNDNEHCYYFSWFSHVNPYASGLPEMLSDYGGVDVRHGTDHFEFDGSETIQPELINMVRWILSWLGGDCCGGEYETCAETDYRSDVCHHNPRFRGSDDGICCAPMPIRFRWSGSNVYPHYLTGGKGLTGGPTPDSRPLHNHPDHVPEEGESWGSEVARKSWRGINMLYSDFEHFNNPFYGGGYSWGTAPGTFTLMYKPVWYSEAKVFAKYPSWGLRSGDVIEAVHIQEIIDAVDYLIDYGVWTTTIVKTTKRTPDVFMGDECGRIVKTGATSADYVLGCLKCCKNATDPIYVGTWCDHDVNKPCSKFQPWQLGGPTGGGVFCPDTCIPFDAPSWEDCWAVGVSSKCNTIAASNSSCSWEDHTHTRRQGTERTRDCDGGSFSPSLPCSPPSGGGIHNHQYLCKEDVGYGQCTETDDSVISCARGVSGFSYYVCTPDKCANGWDEIHGGRFKKNRTDHLWPLNMVATGPLGNEFSGNCLGDIFGCGDIHPSLPGLEGLWFHEVAGVDWRGIVPGWYSDCALLGCSQGCTGMSPEWAMQLPPPVPGYGYVLEETNICTVFNGRAGDCSTGHTCRAQVPSNYAVCKGTSVWVAVDLNLDGSNQPYRNFPGRDGSQPSYVGRGVPRLRDYDLTKDPATWMHSCPCETFKELGTCT